MPATRRHRQAAPSAEAVGPTESAGLRQGAEDASTRKQELLELVSLLSDYECEHLLRAVKDVAVGERFWEGDIGIFYNEYVKARYFNFVRNPAAFGFAAPQSEGGIYAPIPIEKSYPEAQRVPLPPPVRVTTSITDLLKNRRSRRDYAQGSISLAQLATLLELGCGTTGAVSAYGYSNVPLRTFPSTGALQAMEIYLFAQRVDGVASGLYHYNPTGRALELLKPGDHMPMIRELVPGQPGAASSAALLIFTGCYERVRWKYGARAYRYMCMDIGFLGENLHLASEAMSLSFCAIAGFIEDELELYLGINGQDEMALLVASVGLHTSASPASV